MMFVEDAEAAIPKYDAKIDCSIKSFSDRKTEEGKPSQAVINSEAAPEGCQLIKPYKYHCNIHSFIQFIA